MLDITRRDARREALTGLIDYAGLFPPASLDMAAAVAGYRSAREGPDAWMVDRFICPAGRLLELAEILTPSMTAVEAPWRLVVTSGGTEVVRDARAVRDFDAAMTGGAAVEAVEVRTPEEADAEWVSAALTAFDRVVFFEVPPAMELEPALKMLASVREASGRMLGAKIRCGGDSLELFPSPERLASLLVVARQLTLPVKTTAGLHHPVRHLDPDTGFVHHGFLNVLAASALVHEGVEMDEVVAVLSDDDPGSFSLGVGGFTWRERRVSAASLGAMRAELFVGYGSCSFEEPVDDLTEMGVLPL